MGGFTSKAARKTPPSWAGARTPSHIEQGPLRPPPLASAIKNDAIQKDAADPQLLLKLNRLGPVKVDHHMQTIRAEGQAKRMHDSLLQSEKQASRGHPAPNRLLASSLSDLLDARKSVTSRRELEALAKSYNVDVGTLEKLGRYVNTPSVGEGMTVRTLDENGVEHVSMKAVWVEPRIEN